MARVQLPRILEPVPQLPLASRLAQNPPGVRVSFRVKVRNKATVKVGVTPLPSIFGSCSLPVDMFLVLKVVPV